MRRAHIILFAVLALSIAAQAQFLGYTSPQTVQATLATNTTCTGGSQVFTTGVTAGFQNLGQNQHTLTVSVSGSPQFFTAEIDGIDNAGNVQRISDTLRLASFQNSASLYARGYFPQIRVVISCASTGNPSFSALYSGTSQDTSLMLGSFQIAQEAKVIFAGKPAGTTTGDSNLQSPWGNAQGVIAFTYSGGSGPAGSTVVLSCFGNQSAPGNPLIDTFTPATSGTTIFPVPPAVCPFPLIQYNPGGASAATFTLEYDFTPPGSGNQQAIFSATQLGVNALTEPGAGTSALSNIIDTRNVKEGTLDFSCTAGAITVNVQTYNADGTSTATLISPLSAVAAATKTQLYIGSNANDSASGGTISGTSFIRFPQRALAFSFTNAGGAGTCTAQLYLNY